MDSPRSPQQIAIGDTIQIDRRARLLYRDGQRVYLTAKEWDLLLFFLTHHGAFLSHQTILNAVWGELYDRGCLYKMVQKLRQKIGEQLIDTVHRAGYRFVALNDMSPVPDDSPTTPISVDTIDDTAVHLALDPTQHRAIRIVITPAETYVRNP